MWTRIVPPSLTPCGLTINDRPHGSSLRLGVAECGTWREVVTTTRQAARGTVGRALLRRNPRVVPLSLGVPVGVGRRRPIATALRASSRW